MSARVTYGRDGDVGSITIDAQPLNLFDRELTNDLIAAVDAATKDLPRALVVRAEGKVFTGGVDVNIFHGLSESEAHGFAEQLIALTHSIESLPFPTLAVVHGLCLTAGFELSLACDMIWASESATFGLVEIVVGVTPFMGGTQRVAERAGPARARELVMTGGLYDSATLERWNVVNRVVADDELAEKAARFAGPPGRRPDNGQRGHQANRAGPDRRGHPRRRRPHAGCRRAPVRDRGSEERGGVVPTQRAWQSQLPRALTASVSRHAYRNCQVVQRRQGVRLHLTG